jgi:hypothetical protein
MALKHFEIALAATIGQQVGAELKAFRRELEARFVAVETIAKAALDQRQAPGPPGPPGEAGKDGAPGAAGDKGDKGDKGDQGERGTDAPIWEICRLYDPARDYGDRNVVFHDGGSFVSLKDRPGPLPGPDWAQLTLRGKPGAPGLKGQAGRDGKDGEDGQDGEAGASIEEIYSEGSRLFFVLSNNKTLEIELEEGAGR